jgi:uncharacterized membrane protein HdeD (DUF308 family)
MNSASVNSPKTLGTAIHTLHSKWGWILTLGVVFVVAGFVALGSMMLATIISVTSVGVMMLFAGVAEFISAFQMKSWGKFAIWMLLGALYSFAGLFTIEDPLLAAGVLTLFLGVALVASGIVRIALAFQMQHGGSWGLVAFSGLITTLLGATILLHWPHRASTYSACFWGSTCSLPAFGWISLGLALRKRAL